MQTLVDYHKNLDDNCSHGHLDELLANAIKLMDFIFLTRMAIECKIQVRTLV